MSTLSVWKFDTPEGADAAVNTLGNLVRDRLITVSDGATVSWQAGDKKPKTKHLANFAGAGALGGAFWGMLFGLLFLVPLLGAAVGAAAGALAGSLGGKDMNENFVKRTREAVTPGTSALFVLTSNAVQDKVREAFAGQNAELIFTNLSDADEDSLRKAFAE